MTLTRTQKRWTIGGGLGALALAIGYEVLHRKHAPHQIHTHKHHDGEHERGEYGHRKHHHKGHEHE